MTLVVRDDTEKARQYGIMRRRATMLLGVFAALFVAITAYEHQHPNFAPFWIGLVRATCEAAMVGGVADWFAVTALFRHPLGIPIPHTAIVAERKDRIGRSLGNFVGNNFLAHDVIARQLSGMRLGERGAQWLALPQHQQQVASALAGALARAAESIPSDELHDVVHTAVVEQLGKVKVAPLLAELLNLATTDDRHHEMLDRLVILMSTVVQDNKELIRTRIAQESPWWVPEAVDDKVFQKIVMGIERTLAQVAADPNHPLREKFDVAIRSFVDKLHSSPETIQRAEGMKERLLGHPAVGELTDALVNTAQTALARYGEPDAPSPDPLQKALGAVAGRLLTNDALLREIDGAIERVILGVVDQYRPEVAELIARTVEGWDATDASRKIEVQIGRDLQFIRINGTLVGGLVGLILYVIGDLVH